MEQTKALLLMQDADIRLLRVRRMLDALPQMAEIDKTKQVRAALQDKADQVDQLRMGYEDKVEALQDEDARLIDMIAKSRQTIDTTRDFRVITSVTRDMEGSMKRRENIEFELGKLADQLEKAAAVYEVAMQKIEACDKREDELMVEVRAVASKSQDEVDSARRQRAEAQASLPDELIERYERLKKQKGGIGAAKLEDGRCSVCSIELNAGQLNKLKHGPDIGICPNCRRLIVVREQS